MFVQKGLAYVLPVIGVEAITGNIQA